MIFCFSKQLFIRFDLVASCICVLESALTGRKTGTYFESTMQQRSISTTTKKTKKTDHLDIQRKIDDLFAYRRLTDVFRQSGIGEGDPLIENLKNLQFRIYKLDAYLESNWYLEEASLDTLWADIRSALLPFGIERDKEQKSVLREIVQYEHIEKKCRSGKWPTAVSFDTFYRTKSCDVRLIRQLVYNGKPDLKALYPLKAWVCYDLVTEVNDDISDLYEDLPTWNANRFLISILRKGHLKTDKAYQHFLAQVAYRTQTYFEKGYSKGQQSQLFEWTVERLLETQHLLRECMDTLDHGRLANSHLFEKMR